MLVRRNTFASCPLNAFHQFVIVLLVVVYIHVPATAIVAVPSSHCYTFDSDSHLVDFTYLSGKNFEYSEEGSVTSDLVVQLCKDVQRRSQAGFIDFGRFINHRSFQTGSKPIDYIQRFHNGDLAKCETTFEEMGRTAQVNIICGRCSTKVCKDELGCICSISYDERICRAVVELAIPCPKRGPRVFKGFTVGFHPRSSEVVYNGLTQLGFEQLHHGFSFPSEQIHVSLYLSAVSSLADLVGKPTFRVNPMKGLDVMLTGSGANGAVPTALSPTVLNVNWICEIIRSNPYVVNVSIPVVGYDPIEFTLTKECGYTQERESDSMRDVLMLFPHPGDLVAGELKAGSSCRFSWAAGLVCSFGCRLRALAACHGGVRRRRRFWAPPGPHRRGVLCRLRICGAASPIEAGVAAASALTRILCSGSAVASMRALASVWSYGACTGARSRRSCVGFVCRRDPGDAGSAAGLWLKVIDGFGWRSSSISTGRVVAGLGEVVGIFPTGAPYRRCASPATAGLRGTPQSSSSVRGFARAWFSGVPCSSRRRGDGGLLAVRRRQRTQGPGGLFFVLFCFPGLSL